MSRASDLLSREQRAKLDFGRAIGDLRNRFTHTDSIAALDSIAEGALRFGVCELRMRRAERLKTLDPNDPAIKPLRTIAIANNKRGLAALAGVRSFAKALAAAEVDSEKLEQWRKVSSDLRAEWREQVSQLDVNSEKARHIVRIMDECCKALDSSGAAGLGQHLLDTLAELEKQRRAPNRGTQESSFPWWKIVAAALIMGLTALEIYILVTTGAPWWQFYLVALFNCILMLFAALGC